MQSSTAPRHVHGPQHSDILMCDEVQLDAVAACKIPVATPR